MGTMFEDGSIIVSMQIFVTVVRSIFALELS